MVDSLSILCILVSVLISRSGVQGRHLFALVAPVAARRSGQRRVTGVRRKCHVHVPPACPLPSGHQPGHTSHRHTGKLDQEQVAWVMGV